MTSGWRIEVPTAIEYFASLVAQDDGFPLLEASLAVAQDEYPDLDPLSVLSEVDALSERLARRIPADASAVQRLRYLNRYFFQEVGFRGNVNDYYDPRNSYLNDVLAMRRGIPISLAVIYMEMAGVVNLTARGVSFPGHFLVKIRMPAGEVVIDPFTGESLSREALEERLAPYRRQRGLPGDAQVPLSLFLQSATPREIVARMLRNLKEVHRSAGDWLRMTAVCERLVCLLPGVWDETRDRGLALAHAGRTEAALADLRSYLDHRPDAEDAPAVALRLDELRRTARPRLH
jgi:regulator of sirC expression with transglutaminase-like and TPR domain